MGERDGVKDAGTPPPRPLPEAGRGSQSESLPPPRFGEGAGGRGCSAQFSRGPGESHPVVIGGRFRPGGR